MTVAVKKEKKREKIIEAASYLFSQKSYHEVMMEDVAKMISVAKGTVYNYFDSKEELYFSIMRIRMEKLLSSLRKKISTEMNGVVSLYTFIIHVFMFMIRYKNFFLMYQKEFLNAENKLCKDLRDLDNELKKMLIEIINRGHTENIFRHLGNEFAANMVLGSIYGVVSNAIMNNHTEEVLNRDREKIFDFVLNGLLNESSNNHLLPLKGKIIVITRSLEQSKQSEEQFARLGAHVITFPTLSIVPPHSWDEFDAAVKKFNSIDYIIFTSANAVKMFAQRINELNLSPDYENKKIVAVGSKTAQICNTYNIPVQIIPEDFSAKGVIDTLTRNNLTGKKIFIPRSAIGREELPVALDRAGADILAVPVYNVDIPDRAQIQVYIDELRNNRPDMFIFTSPSGFTNFLKIMGIDNPSQYFKEFKLAAIGPTTKSSIENAGVEISVMPDEYTLDGLVNSVVNFYSDTYKGDSN